MKHVVRFAGNTSDVARRKDRAAGRKQVHQLATNIDEESEAEKEFAAEQEALNASARDNESASDARDEIYEAPPSRFRMKF